MRQCFVVDHEMCWYCIPVELRFEFFHRRDLLVAAQIEESKHNMEQSYVNTANEKYNQFFGLFERYRLRDAVSDYCFNSLIESVNG